jgi:hypothetical protein
MPVAGEKQYLNKIQPEQANFNRKAKDIPAFFMNWRKKPVRQSKGVRCVSSCKKEERLFVMQT